MNPECLKKQLEELIIFQVEQDIVDYPHSKAEFAPYVVCSLLKKVPVDQIPADVLEQLDKQIELAKMFPKPATPKKQSLFKKVKKWILSKFSKIR